MTERSLQYRPYLDGLRGIAVILVFVFHAARPGLPGGFIGVDIFFVLSGYLITRILIAQHAKTGRIRIADFYARRIRRLMPAVILLVMVVVVREALWGDLLQLASRMRDGLATLFYAENWNLISQSDQYFQEAATASPLRHAWSLSIEEQFYLLWPLILIPILAFGRQRLRRSTVVVMTLAGVSAVAMAVLFEPGLVTRAYYGTDSRVHQPLIGAVLAFLMVRPGSEESRQERAYYRWPILAAVSLGGLAVAARVLTGASPAYYRGGSVVVAVLTAILILALERSPRGWASRSLGWNPLKQLGRISYGFYLWHWPIILWLTVPEGFDFWERRVVNLAQFGLTLAISTASFVLLENPIRERSTRLGRLKSPATIAVGLTTLVAAGVFTYAVLAQATVLPPDRTEPATDATGVPTDETGPTLDPAELAATAIADPSYEPCPDNPEPCVKVDGASPESPTVVLIGDSTAQSYDPALKELAARYGFRYVQAAVGGCPISHRLLATGTDGELHKPSNFLCFDELPGIYEKVIEEYQPALILATSWNETNQHMEGDRLLERGTSEHLEATTAALRDTVDYLLSGGARLAFIEVLPPGYSVDCLKQGSPTSDSCIRPITDESGERPYNEIFASLADELNPDVVAISLTDVVCPDDQCPLTVDDMVQRYDGGHLTATASRHLVPRLDQRLLEAGVDLSNLVNLTSSRNGAFG
jgi:peptidoglycan/LPS O-acetylase OafA/YrhL